MLLLLIEITLGALVAVGCWVALELRRVWQALREDTVTMEAWEAQLAELDARAHLRPQEARHDDR